MDYIDFYNKAVQMKQDGNFLDSYNCLKDCIDSLESNLIVVPISFMRNNNSRKLYVNAIDEVENPIEPKNLIKIYGSAGEVAAQLDLYNESVKYYEKMQEWTIYSFSGIETIPHLLSFRPITQYSLSDLANNTINISRPEVLNDPYDTFVLEWLKQKEDESPAKKHIPPLRESFMSYRIRSFVNAESRINGKKAITDTLMWSHYADSHKGFCLEYEFENDFCNDSISFENVSYVDVDFTKDSLSLTEAFATKSRCWRKENEIRLISYDASNKSNYSKIQLTDKGRVKYIYFGIKCPPDIRNLVCSIVKDKEIKFYEMVPANQKHPYSINPVHNKNH